MSLYLGIDTSNYTTSLALCDDDGNITAQIKRLLTVKDGERGLRQSDAVFAHTVNLPELTEELFTAAGIKGSDISAVGASAYPRDIEGSYMPCFLTGLGMARSLCAFSGLDLYRFSHQSGHIAAAVYSCGDDELWDGGFHAFHISGGTTEILHVSQGGIKTLGGTLDLNAGQAIDRVGVALGISFPCGPALEHEALSWLSDSKNTDCAGNMNPKICVNGFDCNLSGLENQALAMISAGKPAGEIAYYTLLFIAKTLERLTENVLADKPTKCVLYAGGVMANSIIKQRLSRRFNARFAEPVYSTDNAAGISLLCRRTCLGLPIWMKN